jgi:hypothetical protein
MCVVCYEVAAAGVAAVVGWRLWLHRVIRLIGRILCIAKRVVMTLT